MKSKTEKFDEFESAFPTPEAKSIYLSNLALRTVAGAKLTREAAQVLLENTTSLSKNINLFQLANEALNYFELAGLTMCGESVRRGLESLDPAVRAFSWLISSFNEFAVA